MVREGRDGLAEWSDRMVGVVDETLSRGMGRQGKILLMGSSRHGFGVLHATALNPRVDATVAIGPVIWWPWLKEFHGMDDDPILAKHHLIDLAGSIAPRPALVQIGYDDKRVGQHLNRRFVKAMNSAYAAAGASERFTAQSLEKRGHDVVPVPMSVNRFVITWMERRGFL